MSREVAQSAIGHLSNRLNETIAGARVESFTLPLLASADHESKHSIPAIPLKFRKLKKY